jgi:hypothetical protein
VITYTFLFFQLFVFFGIGPIRAQASVESRAEEIRLMNIQDHLPSSPIKKNYVDHLKLALTCPPQDFAKMRPYLHYYQRILPLLAEKFDLLKGKEVSQILPCFKKCLIQWENKEVTGEEEREHYLFWQRFVGLFDQQDWKKAGEKETCSHPDIEKACLLSNEIPPYEDFAGLNSFLLSGHVGAFFYQILALKKESVEGCMSLHGGLAEKKNSFFEKRGEEFKKDRLFKAATMQEFDFKGLGHLFYPPQSLEIFYTKKEEKKDIVPPLMTQVEKNVEQPVVVEKRKEKKKIEKIDSAFKVAEKAFYLQKKPQSVDMLRFTQEMSFTGGVEEFLKNEFDHFFSLKNLEIMKVEDRVGSRDVPMKLLILKYFLDNKKFHYLYNIKKILGDEFYIENDLEQNSKAIKIRLNDTPIWQIVVIGE